MKDPLLADDLRAKSDREDAGGASLGRAGAEPGGLPGARRLSDRAVALIIQRAAAQAGVGERAIMAQTGHRAVTMVRRYIRDGSLFRDNAAARVGL